MSPQPLSLQERLSGLMLEHKLSANRVADDIGYSAAVVSTWLRGKYTGNISDVDQAVEAYLQQWSEKSHYSTIGTKFCLTQNAKTVFGAARRAHLDHKICMVTGESGFGKSRGVKEYAARNRTALLVECDVTYNAKILIATLHKALGLGGHGSKNSMLTECIQQLANTERLVIVDEADLLSIDTIEMLRALHDKSQIGILLTGLPELLEIIRGSKGYLQRVNNRVAGHVSLAPLNTMDVSLLVRAQVPGASDDLIKAFYQHSRKNARTLDNLLFNALRISQEIKSDIDVALVERCAALAVV